MLVVVVDVLLTGLGGTVAGDAGDGCRIDVGRKILDVGGTLGGFALLEPGEVLSPDLDASAEAVGQGGPAALGEAAEGADGGEFAANGPSAIEFLEEMVVGIDLWDSGSRGEAGGEAEGGPVAPLAIDVAGMDAGGFVEFEESDVGTGPGSQGPQFIEERFASLHGEAQGEGMGVVVGMDERAGVSHLTLMGFCCAEFPLEESGEWLVLSEEPGDGGPAIGNRRGMEDLAGARTTFADGFDSPLAPIEEATGAVTPQMNNALPQRIGQDVA